MLNLAVNESGQACLFQDVPFLSLPGAAVFHRRSARLGLVFPKVGEDVVAADIPDSIGEYLSQATSLLLVLVEDGVPVKGWDISLSQDSDG